MTHRSLISFTRRGSSVTLLLVLCMLKAQPAIAQRSFRQQQPAPAYADTVLINGKIVTVDPQFRLAQAVAIRDGRFLAVGSNAEISRFLGPTTHRVDLAGHAVLPGLIDTHAHIAAAGEEGSTVSFAGATTVREAVERIKQWAANTKPGDWIIGGAWHPPSQLAEKRYLTRQDIDDVAPNNPVFLPTVGHFAMANAMALSLAGIDRNTPNPPGGLIDKGPDGIPNGVLEESAIGILSRVVPAPLASERVERLQTAMRVFNSFGLTSAVDGGTGPEGFRTYQTLWESKQMTLRVTAMFTPAQSGATTSVEDWENTFRSLGAASGFGNEWLRLGAIGEMIVDGGMTLRTAFMRDPYPGETSYYGFAAIPGDKLKRLVDVCNTFGWRVGVHVVGDAAIDAALDAYEYASGHNSILNKRFSLIHASLIRQDQLERARRLGVRLEMQSVFMWDKADTVARFIGQERANRAVPLRQAIDSLGIEHIGAGTDFPVNPLNPFLNMYVMVTRRNPDGKVYGTDQAITRQEALKLYTTSAAAFSFEESLKGSIEPGKLADLIEISDDILTVPTESIKRIQALMTMVGGNVVYRH